MQILKDLLGNGYFWGALTTLLFVLQAWLLPAIPSNVVDAFRLVLIIIFGTIAARYATAQMQVRAQNEQ